MVELIDITTKDSLPQYIQLQNGKSVGLWTVKSINISGVNQ